MLERKGWLTTTPADTGASAVYTLTNRGVRDSVSLLAIAKSHEEDLLEQMGPVDGLLLKHLLHKFIEKTEGTSPNLWSDEFALTPGAPT
jgi:hypothetical protein